MKIRLVKNITLYDLLGVEPGETIMYAVGTDGELLLDDISLVGYSIVRFHGHAPIGNQDWCISNSSFEKVTDNQ